MLLFDFCHHLLFTTIFLVSFSLFSVFFTFSSSSSCYCCYCHTILVIIFSLLQSHQARQNYFKNLRPLSGPPATQNHNLEPVRDVTREEQMTQWQVLMNLRLLTISLHLLLNQKSNNLANLYCTEHVHCVHVVLKSQFRVRYGIFALGH